jgi:hypothetical protein
MTPDEARQLFGAIKATWRSVTTDPIGDRLWLGDLAPFDEFDAWAVFRQLRDEKRTAPSWAYFRETYYAKAARRTPTGPTLPALAPEAEYVPTTDDEYVHALCAQLRVGLKEAGVRKAARYTHPRTPPSSRRVNEDDMAPYVERVDVASDGSHVAEVDDIDD